MDTGWPSEADLAYYDAVAFVEEPAMSAEEFLTWLETNPCPYPDDGDLDEVEVAPTRRRQQFLGGIDGLRRDEQALQVARIRWIAAEVAAYTRQAPNPVQEMIQGRVFTAELALTLGITERAAENLIGRARILTTDRTATLDAVEDGRITLRHAEVIADQGAELSGEVGVRFEAAAIIMAEGMTPAKLRNKLIQLRERLQPEDSEARHEDALLDRQIIATPGRDGMGEVWASLSGEAIVAIDAKLDAAVRSIKAAGGEDARTAAQIRADVFVDLLLNDASGVRNIKPVVFMTVPVETAVGGDQPGEVQGQGQMDAQTMRNLMAFAPYFFRVLIHPETGNILEVGTDPRYIPTALRRWVTLRDGTCRFPGCNRKAVGLDLDHVVDFALGGATAPDNLITLCKKHHRLRHLGGWDGILGPDGTVTWTSPSGRIDITHPDNPMTVPKPRPLPRASTGSATGGPPPDPRSSRDVWFIDPEDNAGPVSGPIPF
jgi:hypothetical protein